MSTSCKGAYASISKTILVPFLQPLKTTKNPDCFASEKSSIYHARISSNRSNEL